MSDSLLSVMDNTLRVTLALMWLWSAVAKISDFQQFVRSAQELARPVWPALSRAAAFAVPLIELGLSAALLITRSAFIATASTVAVLTAFALILLRAKLINIETSCHCFGSSDDNSITWFSVIRATLLTLVALTALLASPSAHMALYKSGPATLGIFILAGLLIAGAALVAASMRLLTQVERRVLRSGGS